MVLSRITKWNIIIFFILSYLTNHNFIFHFLFLQICCFILTLSIFCVLTTILSILSLLYDILYMFFWGVKLFKSTDIIVIWCIFNIILLYFDKKITSVKLLIRTTSSTERLYRRKFCLFVFICDFICVRQLCVNRWWWNDQVLCYEAEKIRKNADEFIGVCICVF